MGVRVTGERELEQKLADQARRMRDPGPVLEQLARELRAILLEAWASARAPDGSAWAPRVLASRDVNTGRARPRRDTRGRLLERTGLLERSERVGVSGRSIVVENDAPYAKFVNFGTRFMRVRKIVPAPGDRGPAGDWLARLPDRIARYIAEGSVRP